MFRAPAHSRSGCAGVLFLAALAAGCRDRPGQAPVVLELEKDTVRLAPGVQLIEIAVSRSAGREFDPDSAVARPGDVLRFTARDGHSHAIVFAGESLAAEAAAFLERTGQRRGPPLLDDGASWVVSLENAPPGVYAFQCVTHAATGRIVVVPAAAPPPR